MSANFISAIATCIQQHIPYTPILDVQTPFQILSVSQKNIAFHLVDLATYKTLSAQKKCECFFCNLSKEYEQQGIQLIHVWEDMWRRQPIQVEARIAALLGHFIRYHARLTTVTKITNPVLIDFLQQHHLQVAIGGRYKYGLFYKEELLAAVSFSAVRPMMRDGVEYRSYELLRFANKTGCVVAGGLSKLLAHFIKEQNPDDIMTYVDCDWGSGKGYKMLGFEQVGELPPQAFLLDTKNYTRYYEHQIAADIFQKNNALSVFNSGSCKFILDLKIENRK